MSETVITDQIGRNYFNIPDKAHLIWGREHSAKNSISRSVILKMWTNDEIPKEAFEIAQFLMRAKFATASQIKRGTGLDKIGDDDFSDESLRKLYDLFIVNQLVVSQMNRDSDFENDKALRVYTLDFAGKYILTQEGEDTNSWYFYQLLVGAKLLKKYLMMTELIIELSNAPRLDLRNVKFMPEYLLGKTTSATADFEVSMNVKGKESDLINFTGFVVEPYREDLYFADELRNLSEIVLKTEAWKKYFPDGRKSSRPKLMAIVQDMSIKEQLQATLRVISNTSEYQGKDVFVMGYTDIIENGLSNANILTLTISKNEDNSRKVQFGRANFQIFK